MSKKKMALAVVCVVLVVALLVGFSGPGMGGGSGSGQPTAGADASTVRTVTLEKGDIRSTVSSTGTVYSVNSVNVYSNLSYPIQAVNVSVGDKVEEGDILAELDTASLESDISQKQAQVYSSQSSAQQTLKTAQEDLASYQSTLDSEMDSNLLSAQNSVTAAESSVAAAELELQSANSNLSLSRRSYNSARNGDEDEEYTDSQLRDMQADVAQKEISVEKAQNSLDTKKTELENAKKNLEVAQNSSNETIRNYQNQIKSAQLNTNYNADYISIEKLQDDVEKCVVTAPVSGTITAVNAIEGNSGNGLLFVIQKTDDLKVVTNIKEYDIATVGIGDTVIIKTDATGDEEFSGTLTKIAPTSTLTATGETTSSTDAEFEAEVAVNSGADSLRIGMNARLSIVTEEHTGVFSVPFEAVDTINGKSYVYILREGEDGTSSYEAVEVTQGLETNVNVEIAGEGLEEGMKVVKNASAIDRSLIVSDPSGGEMPAGIEGDLPEGVEPPQAGGEQPAESTEQENSTPALNAEEEAATE